MSSNPPAARFALLWVLFAALFVVLQFLFSDDTPDAFGYLVLVVAALPVAALLTWRSTRA